MAWLKSNKELLGLFVAIGGFLFGLYQYYSAQVWKGTEFAAKQVELLSSDPKISIASRALEWNNRKFRVPEKMDVEIKEEFFQHDPEKLASALIPHSEKKEFENTDIFYLDVYDHYFNYLERVNHYLSQGMFSIDDIEPICYRATLLTEANNLEYSKIKAYLDFYNFTDVIELIERCQEASS
ncbi:hypothetical protein VIBNISOn1_1530007 [Vibrio nigripulchritudo SOn1]|uniref:Uncharacterized protein n=1 Tax=Vibrio nigripulchritudo SOn1 TaxID=1238450 RepID=A0AAV2VLM4_9VIBR|nr:hypothetical protein [Vibrio nigripulchritudo]CCO45553.1 hypothetical protein VIBNISOn1_1530007 [Vibrio nigripulchritudo SOn1]